MVTCNVNRECILLVFISDKVDWFRVFLISRMLRCDWFIFFTAMISAFRSSMFVHCSHGGPLSYGSPVVVFFYRGHPRFRNFYSIVPVDDVRVNINSHMLTITLLNDTDLRTTLLTGTLRNVYAKPKAPTTSTTYSEKLAY